MLYTHFYTLHAFSINIFNSSVKHDRDSGPIWIRCDQHLLCHSEHQYKRTVLSCCGDKTEKLISFCKFISHIWKMQTCRFKSKMYGKIQRFD